MTVNEIETERDAYLEGIGDTVTTNTWLKVALALVLVLLLVRELQSFSVARAIRTQKPLIVRITDYGKADAVRYQEADEAPQAPEIKYFLSQFVELHYARNPYTAVGDFKKSLYFLDGRARYEAESAMKKSGELVAIASGQDTQTIGIEIKMVTLEQIKTKPFQASVTFDKVYSKGSSGKETSREHYTAGFQFTVLDTVPNELIPINPLGFSILWFHTDEAFQNDTPATH